MTSYHTRKKWYVSPTRFSMLLRHATNLSQELNDAGNNLVTILKAQNLSDQEAMDKIGRMLDACYESWYNAMDELPVWGAGIDQEVRRYLVVCRNVGLGNLHWR
jgi:hypothetical protein